MSKIELAQALQGRRLHAARLAAREYDVSPVVRKWGTVPDATYRAAESGRRKVPEQLLALASQTFEVSQNYLLDGETPLARDSLAARIEGLLARFLTHGFRSVLGDDLPRRLRLARIEAGFNSPRSAAQHFGWTVARYAGHEGRHRGITFDQAMRYATSFGLESAEDLLFGKRQVETHASLVAADQDWSWLRGLGSGDRIGWPTVMLTRERFELVQPILLPARLVDPDLGTAPLYCIFDGTQRETIAYVLAREANSGPVLHLDDGRLVSRDRDVASVATDPLSATDMSASIPLGTICGTMRITSY